MRTFSVTTKKAGRIEFQSPYADGEAIARLQALTMAGMALADNGFARSLAGSAYRGHSASQTAWVHRLVTEADRPAMPAPAPAAAPAGPGPYKAIADLMVKAQQHVKAPRVRLALNGTAVVLKLDSARNVIWINGGKDERKSYGRIDLNGHRRPGRDENPNVETLLAALIADPVQAAKDYGRLTGRCCFCGALLEDERSTEVGYGPVCAEHFGLPWGAAYVKAVENFREAVDWRPAEVMPEDYYAA